MTSHQDASDKHVRKSTAMVAAVLGLVAGWSIYRGNPTAATAIGSLSALLFFLAALVPVGARTFYTGWMKLAAALGYVNTRILLGIFYFGILTPVGLFLRLTGRDSLDRRGARRESYWAPTTRKRQSREQFVRLF